MNNEEMAIQIQDGNEALLPALYEQVRRFINLYSNRYYNRHTATCRHSGITVEDLYQEGYIAFLDAVRAFHRDAGYRFISFLNYPLRNHFNAAVGIRTKKRHPLNESASLNVPIKGIDNDDLSLEDTIEDTEAIKAFEQVEESVYTIQLHAALEECLNRIDEPMRGIITGKYYDGLSQRELANQYKVSYERIRQYEVTGLNRLRRGQCVRILAPYREFISSNYMSGYQAFQRNSTSIEELIAEQRTQRTAYYGTKQLTF